MLKQINRIINTVIGSAVGVLIGYSAFCYWDFKKHPDFYTPQSAPWYSSVLLWGSVTMGILITVLIIKIILRKISKNS